MSKRRLFLPFVIAVMAVLVSAPDPESAGAKGKNNQLRRADESTTEGLLTDDSDQQPDSKQGAQLMESVGSFPLFI